jgi:hypothetical protein
VLLKIRKNEKRFTAETLRTQRKEFLIKKYSELGELCASVVWKNPED